MRPFSLSDPYLPPSPKGQGHAHAWHEAHKEGLLNLDGPPFNWRTRRELLQGSSCHLRSEMSTKTIPGSEPPASRIYGCVIGLDVDSALCLIAWGFLN